jgi:hypothetical protein
VYYGNLGADRKKLKKRSAAPCLRPLYGPKGDIRIHYFKILTAIEVEKWGSISGISTYLGAI